MSLESNNVSHCVVKALISSHLISSPPPMLWRCVAFYTTLQFIHPDTPDQQTKRMQQGSVLALFLFNAYPNYQTLMKGCSIVYVCKNIHKHTFVCQP